MGIPNRVRAVRERVREERVRGEEGGEAVPTFDVVAATVDTCLKRWRLRCWWRDQGESHR